MIAPKQREAKTLLGTSRTKAIRLIRTGTALLLLAASATVICGQSTEVVKAAGNKSQLSPQEQSIRRDQVYVHQLLQKGTPDAKVESVLQLSSRFTSFNPIGDFHAYALSLIAKEKTALKQSKLTQQAGVGSQAAPTAAVSDSSPVASGAIAFAPSNPVGINSVKSSQESNREPAQDAVPTTTPDNNQAAAANSSPAGFGGGLFLPTTAASNGGGSAQASSAFTSSNSNGATGSGSSSAHKSGFAGSSNGGSGNSNTFNSDQGPGPGPIGPGPGCNLFPAPPSVGATVPLTYFGPPPSETNSSLVGPVQLLKSGTVDATRGTITLPLYLGHMKGSKKNVWYILTDVDDPNVAAKLTFASNAARTATLAADGTVVFDKGTVDFSLVRSIVPGPSGAEFPPASAQP